MAKKKVKEDNSWQVKYRCVVDEKRFERVKSDYEKIKTLHTDWNSVILINELDENKEKGQMNLFDFDYE